MAAGVRRIEALTGPGAYEHVRGAERTLARLGELLKSGPDVIVKRVEALLDDVKTLEKQLAEAQRGGRGNIVPDVSPGHAS